MRRKRHQMRPEVEGLESMTLLSGASATLHASAALVAQAATAATQQAATPISLRGTASGRFLGRQNNPDVGTTYRLLAQGSVLPIGPGIVTGSFRTPGLILNGQASGNLILSSLRGSVTVHIVQVPTTTATAANPSGTQTFHFTYTVTHGTGRFRNRQGSGLLDVTLRTSATITGRGPARTTTGGVTLTFSASPTTTT